MKTFKTSDFQTATYIFARHRLIPSIAWIDVNKAEFVFIGDVDFEKITQDFLHGKKDVSPLQMFDAISRLKTLLFGSKKNRRDNYGNGYKKFHGAV